MKKILQIAYNNEFSDIKIIQLKVSQFFVTLGILSIHQALFAAYSLPQNKCK